MELHSPLDRWWPGSAVVFIPELKHIIDAGVHNWYRALATEHRLVTWIRVFGDEVAQFGAGFESMVDELLLYYSRVYALCTHILHVLRGKSRLRGYSTQHGLQTLIGNMESSLNDMLNRDKVWAARLQVARACMIEPTDTLVGLFTETDDAAFFACVKALLGRPITEEGTISHTIHAC